MKEVKHKINLFIWIDIHRNIVTRNNILWKYVPQNSDFFENMLKSIAMARSECTVKHKDKASYNIDYIVPDLVDFFGDD